MWWRRQREGVTVKRVACGAGDTLVIEYPGALSEEEVAHVREGVSRALAGGRVMVLTDGLRVSAVLAGEPVSPSPMIREARG